MTTQVTLQIPANWSVREEEQLKARTSKFDVSKVKLGLLTRQEWTSYGEVYKRFSKFDPSKCRLLEAECVNALLANEDSIPVEWREFTLQFWGTIFRVDTSDRRDGSGRCGDPRIIEMFWEELLGRWTVCGHGLNYIMDNEPKLESILTTIRGEYNTRVLFIE